METPKRKVNKLSMSYRSSTPKNESDIQLDNDYSPLFMSNTQDCIDSIDVVWDWNSPQTKGKMKADKPTKRLYSSKPPTSFPSTHPEPQIPSFNKLKEQLERLRNQLIIDSAEKGTKEAASNTITYRRDSPVRSTASLPKPRNLLTKSFSSESLGSSLCDDDFNISDIIKKAVKSPKKDRQRPGNESLEIDVALDEFQEEDYELLSQVIPLKSINTKPEIVENNRIIDKSLCRKSKSNSHVVSNAKHYSQEEIEKKRKLALSKLEERRIEDIIEKKRQQALLRLENSKKRNFKITTAIKRYNSS